MLEGGGGQDDVGEGVGGGGLDFVVVAGEVADVVDGGETVSHVASRVAGSCSSHVRHRRATSTPSASTGVTSR